MPLNTAMSQPPLTPSHIISIFEMYKNFSELERGSTAKRHMDCKKRPPFRTLGHHEDSCPCSVLRSRVSLRQQGIPKMTKLSRRILAAVAFFPAILAGTPAHAELSAEDLAKIAQNPVGNLISVPFQENAYFNVGPLERRQNVLNIQPVIPILITDDWNIITRTILPIISLPGFVPGQGTTNGIGDVQISAFLSPAKPGAWIWGVGVITQLPTHSNDLLGNNNAGLGTHCRISAPRARQPVGVWRARQQCLVNREQRDAHIKHGRSTTTV